MWRSLILALSSAMLWHYSCVLWSYDKSVVELIAVKFNVSGNGQGGSFNGNGRWAFGMNIANFPNFSFNFRCSKYSLRQYWKILKLYDLCSILLLVFIIFVHLIAKKINWFFLIIFSNFRTRPIPFEGLSREQSIYAKISCRWKLLRFKRRTQSFLV